MLHPRMDISPKGIFSGGHTNSVLRLAKGLKSRHEILILTGCTQKNFSNIKNITLGLTQLIPICVRSPRSSVLYAIEYMIKALYKLLRFQSSGIKFDIIHGHSGYPHYSILTMLAGKIFKALSIQTLYCPISTEVIDYKHLILNHRISKYPLSKLNKIISISKNTAISVANIGISEDKIIVIPPPLDIELYNPKCSASTMRSRIGDNGPLILFVGNLTKTKGLDVLIESIPLVLEKYSKAKLIFTLDTEMKNSSYEDRRKKEIYDKIENLGIKHSILEFGIVENMFELIAASDLFVAPFLSTAGPSDYPIPVLEAMAIGKPVIATNVGGIGEIIENGKTGILIRPNSVNELAKSIIETIDNTELQKEIGKNASSIISEHFSVQNVVSMMENVYNEK